MNITIIGSGYVGLVTTACFASRGNIVTCVDIDEDKIESLNNNNIPIYEPGLSESIKESSGRGSIFFTSNYKKSIMETSIIFIAVGTPMKDDGSSNLDFVYDCAKTIGKYIQPKTIVITKSTIPVGTTYQVKKIIAEEIKRRGKKISFDIANNPEFLKQGRAMDDFNSPDRIIIGLENDNNKSILKDLYKPFSTNHEKLIFMDICSSELTKYAANAMLATKISFINEMSIIAEKVGADINMVRNGVGSDSRIGYSYIYPSLGYGGSCFPKDVNAIINFSKKHNYSPGILESVNAVNDNQKKYFFKKILDRFFKKDKEEKQFAIWGLSFKPRTDDIRGSASIYIINELIKLRSNIKVYDPEAMDNAKENYFRNISEIEYCQNKYDVLDGSCALVLITEWPEFRSPDFDLIKSKLKYPVIFDGRNQYDSNKMNRLGFEYYQIGKNGS
jgi:UDPglucose 6-dehydrogenase